MWLSGMRDKRSITTHQIYVGSKSMEPDAMPAMLPDSEPETTPDTDVFVPPKHSRPGIHVWLTPREERDVMGAMDAATCEQMQALGYVECRQP